MGDVCQQDSALMGLPESSRFPRLLEIVEAEMHRLGVPIKQTLDEADNSDDPNYNQQGDFWFG